ncbi:MAG: lipid-A-disaccharide synthase [Gemmatimonadetes bacterium]|nr:lipid-A-disaccharide synthase [Gemmatimonadota bacterium]
MPDLRVFVSAGEASGDLHGAALVEAIRRRHPGAEFWGLGGPRMQAAGVRLLAGLERLAVAGLVEVARHLPFFFRLRQRVAAELERRRPHVVIPIDYPGFNLWLAKSARRRGLRILYYIAPQVWAWHRSRVRTLARITDAVAVVFPFEESLLRSAGVRARFVGHPLVERALSWPTRGEARRLLGLDPSVPVLALFPGSRATEVQRLLEPFREAACLVRGRRSEVMCVVARAPGLGEALYEPAAPFRVTGDGTAALCAATAILTKPGTTTVEAALAGRPMVIAYRVHPITYAIARRVVKVPYIGMVNLLSGRELVPEFTQGAALPARLAEALHPLLDENAEERREMLDGLAALRTALGPPGASDRAAELADEILAAGAR